MFQKNINVRTVRYVLINVTNYFIYEKFILCDI